jgi:hypothetical protein
MLRLLKILFLGHIHNWEIIDERKGNWSNDMGEYGAYTLYTLQCKECGDLKRKVIKF